MRNVKSLIEAMKVGDVLRLTRSEMNKAAAVCKNKNNWKCVTRRLMFRNGRCHDLSADDNVIVFALYDGEIDRLLRDGNPIPFNEGILRDVLIMTEEIPRKNLTEREDVNNLLQRYVTNPNNVVLRVIIEDINEKGNE